MGTKSVGNCYRKLSILSIIANVIFASFAGFSIWQTGNLESQINHLSNSYNEVTDSYRDLEKKLDLARTQLDYYKEQAEHYSSLVTSGNATTGIIGHTTIHIVALRTTQTDFHAEYEGVARAL